MPPKIPGPLGKRLGKDFITDLLFPEPLNEDESILDLERRKIERQRRYRQNNDVDMKFYFDLFMDTHGEQYLWDKYGDRYDNDPFYREQLPRARQEPGEKPDNPHEPDF